MGFGKIPTMMASSHPVGSGCIIVKRLKHFWDEISWNLTRDFAHLSTQFVKSQPKNSALWNMVSECTLGLSALYVIKNHKTVRPLVRGLLSFVFDLQRNTFSVFPARSKQDPSKLRKKQTTHSYIAPSSSRGAVLKLNPTRWAPSSSKWGYNSDK